MDARGPEEEPSPVDRSVLFRSGVCTIRDNRCRRNTAELSKPTRPLPFHEICVPRAGVWIRHFEGRELPVTAGTIHFLNCGEVHRVSHPGQCGDRNIGIAIDDRTLLSLAAEIDAAAVDRQERPFGRTHVEADPEVHLLLSYLLRHLVETPPAAMFVEEVVLWIVARALRLACRSPRPVGQSKTTAVRHRELVVRTRSYLAIHFAEDVDLYRLADAVGSSPHHLSRIYRAWTGTTIHNHLLRLRMFGALERIADGGTALADVAAATGFSDRSHLSRQFRDIFGLSPSSFRSPVSAARIRDLLLRQEI